MELKTGEFKPEYAGQLNFYLSAVDGILKKDVDNPSIGLLLCKSKNNLVAEYSLKDISKPIGVSEYKVTSNLTGELEKQLPSVEDIQNRIKWAFLKFVKSILPYVLTEFICILTTIWPLLCNHIPKCRKSLLWQPTTGFFLF